MTVVTGLPAQPADALPLQVWHRRDDRFRLAKLQRWRLLTEGSLVLLAGVLVGLDFPSALGKIPADWLLLASGVAAVVALNASQARSSVRFSAVALAIQISLAVVAGGATLSLTGVPWRAAVDWAVTDAMVVGFLLVSQAVVFTGWLRRLLADGRLATQVAVVGNGIVARRIEARIVAGKRQLVGIVGRYADEPGAGLRGSLRTLLCDCRLGIVDAIVLAPEADDEEGVRLWCAKLRACAQDVYLAADLMEHAPVNARVFALGTTPVLLLSQRPIAGWQAVGKLLLDQVGAMLLIAFLGPLLLLLAAAIKLDSKGPALFRQLRVGYNNELFHIYKFRSMFAHSTDRLAKQQTTHGDIRVTRVGRIIRRLSLDELPQLLNVLRGEMSLVGPRPHAPGTSVGGQRLHALVADYGRRHLVRPGITGLAQVRGSRGGLQHSRQLQDRLASDLEYIECWSLWLDIKILVLTVYSELRGSNAC